ncbi:MAG: hypothetical protein HOB84_02065 [Candidatus Marinimicrobia bacterium]|jgi:hypothetical protein|nr:hypothetical protein [Candidatus Neomarinimicrobiota bacterium]MBT4361118.1 hypothetical protein [Candidatus Neomarinimicrobiota bacterium]MBT4713540.1 hypothetical protein [Candidatus Neomarinimicrobiota bacterium]MBT4946648.1 hypothetical protein [Candidatus Neomarinimicrobiota bacterium]MBT5268643.1 hypothetical protein [Candidatus Neomarinimicrobiota bacterium]
MLSRIYQGAEGLQFFQGLSLVLFFLVFVGAIVMIVTMQRGHIDKMSKMPLESGDDKNNGGLK